ncbi:hypothetical protein C8R43DRAFT_640311 [Mycena crocata]|nr:hypothetical protein C8R43DRAFT_640311 [Mycena crocata]
MVRTLWADYTRYVPFWITRDVAFAYFVNAPVPACARHYYLFTHRILSRLIVFFEVFLRSYSLYGMLLPRFNVRFFPSASHSFLIRLCANHSSLQCTRFSRAVCSDPFQEPGLTQLTLYIKYSSGLDAHRVNWIFCALGKLPSRNTAGLVAGAHSGDFTAPSLTDSRRNLLNLHLLDLTPEYHFDHTPRRTRSAKSDRDTRIHLTQRHPIQR